MRWISLLFWLALCFAVAGISAQWTASEIPGWDRTLVRPAMAPPNWVFGPVWTLLYAFMAIAVWMVGQSAPSPLRTWALVLFLVQLGLNFAWSWLFFHHHDLGASLVDIGFLWAALAATTFLFARVVPLTAWMLAPYLAWVSFAAILNAAYWRLN